MSCGVLPYARRSAIAFRISITREPEYGFVPIQASDGGEADGYIGPGGVMVTCFAGVV